VSEKPENLAFRLDFGQLGKVYGGCLQAAEGYVIRGDFGQSPVHERLGTSINSQLNKSYRQATFGKNPIISSSYHIKKTST